MRICCLCFSVHASLLSPHFFQNHETEVMRLYMRRKGNEMALAEKECRLKDEQISNVKGNVEGLIKENHRLVALIRAKESELGLAKNDTHRSTHVCKEGVA